MSADEEKDWPFWYGRSSVQSAGGLIDPGTLDEFHRMGCGWVRHFLRTAIDEHREDEFSDQIKNVSLFFIDNSDVNAFALHVGDRRAIGVTLGAVRQLWWLFYRAVNLPEFFDFWLTSDIPVPTDVPLEEAIKDPVWPHATEARSTWPADRKELLYDLFFRSVHFLIYHELAHHSRGHIDYVRRHLGMSEIDEALNMSSKVSARTKTIQHIEFDADHHALDMLVTALDREIAISEQTEAQAFGEYLMQAVAMMGVFMLLDQSHFPIDEQYQTSHPAAVHRAMRLTSALAKTVQRENGWSDETRMEAHDIAWTQAGIVAPVLGFPEGRWLGENRTAMDHPRFLQEEREFIEFSRRLTQTIIDEENGLI